MVDMTFIWRRYRLSSGIERKANEGKEQRANPSVKFQKRLFHANGLNRFPLHLKFDAKRRPQVRALHDRAAYPDIAGLI
jgi:hypothetical protein